MGRDERIVLGGSGHDRQVCGIGGCADEVFCAVALEVGKIDEFLGVIFGINGSHRGNNGAFGGRYGKLSRFEPGEVGQVFGGDSSLGFHGQSDLVIVLTEAYAHIHRGGYIGVFFHLFGGEHFQSTGHQRIGRFVHQRLHVPDAEGPPIAGVHQDCSQIPGTRRSRGTDGRQQNSGSDEKK